MSYVNLPPEATFVKLERVIRNQKRLMAYNVAVAAMFTSTILASLISLL